MPYIRVIDEDKAEGELKAVYDEIIKGRGKLSNIMKIHSLNPESMVKHLDLYKILMFSRGRSFRDKSELSRELKETIAVVVSKVNNCDYCVRHHAEALLFYWKDEGKVKLLIEDYNKVGFKEKELEILKYAEKLTREPHNITEGDVNKLKVDGWIDEDILLANLITAYFNFVNRIALGLGVEFTEYEASGYKY